MESTSGTYRFSPSMFRSSLDVETKGLTVCAEGIVPQSVSKGKQTACYLQQSRKTRPYIIVCGKQQARAGLHKSRQMPLAKMHAVQDRHPSFERKKHRNQSHRTWSVLAHHIVSPSCIAVLAPLHATYCAACDLDSLGGVPGEYRRDALHNSCHVDARIVIVYEFADPFHLLHGNEESLERRTPRCQVYSEMEKREGRTYILALDRYRSDPRYCT